MRGPAIQNALLVLVHCGKRGCRKDHHAGSVAGSATEISEVRKPDPKFRFELRIVAVNDRVWTGKGEETKVRFPALESIPAREHWPDENMCSIAVRIRYGRFDYFTGETAAAW